ncbi:unnamed protein product [Urochloa decumbens]|uniref:NAC domain-containing protein n=1 Tax=Urochloa decumbens TaxID=240449 RepID=A0ABC9E725_9POAL
MSSKAAEMLGHPPGLKFNPDEDELVEFFLLPRVRGEPSWFPGVVVIDDDTAANTHPAKLLERHGLGGDEDAYFFVRTSDAAARQDRHCAGGGRWVSQRPVPNGACIGGQKVQWRRVNLNLQPSRGKSGGGSNGWVMHEYSLTEPPCPFLKICHVTFSGHGKDAKRVPDGEAGCHAGEPAPKRARAAAANSGSSTCVYGSTAPAMDQGYGAYFPIDQCMEASNQQLLGGAYYLPANVMPYMESKEIQAALLQQVQSSTWSIPFAESAATADVYLEQVPLTEQHQPINQLVQSYSAACAYGSTTTVAGEGSSAAAAHASEGISPTSNQEPQHLPLPTEEQLRNTTDQVIQDGQVQTEQSSFWAAAELFLDISTEEPQHDGLDEQEKQFWRSIGVDTDNLVV